MITSPSKKAIPRRPPPRVPGAPAYPIPNTVGYVSPASSRPTSRPGTPPNPIPIDSPKGSGGISPFSSPGSSPLSTTPPLASASKVPPLKTPFKNFQDETQSPILIRKTSQEPPSTSSSTITSGSPLSPTSPLPPLPPLPSSVTNSAPQRYRTTSTFPTSSTTSTHSSSNSHSNPSDSSFSGIPRVRSATSFGVNDSIRITSNEYVPPSPSASGFPTSASSITLGREGSGGSVSGSGFPRIRSATTMVNPTPDGASPSPSMQPSKSWSNRRQSNIVFHGGTSDNPITIAPVPLPGSTTAFIQSPGTPMSPGGGSPMSPTPSPKILRIHRRSKSEAGSLASPPPPLTTPSSTTSQGHWKNPIQEEDEELDYTTSLEDSPRSRSEGTSEKEPVLRKESADDRIRRESVIAMLEETRRTQESRRKRALSQSPVDISSRVIELPRGGTYVNTDAGPIQIGMPPETIKDSMSLGLTIPTYFVLPKDRFNLQMGMNVAEFEFPAFFNFFIKRTKVTLIMHKEIESKIRAIFQEALLGPADIQWPEEYSEEIPKEAYPDLVKELSFFSKNPFNREEQLSCDTLVNFLFFDENGVVKLDKNVEIHDNKENFLFMQNGSLHASVPGSVYVAPPLHHLVTNEKKVTPFVPPYFGVTMLGNSDGFDPNGSTTGFVLWMNRRGLMVDPPPHSGNLLKRLGIHPRLMRGVILTHCHADHDAGTFQKILEEGRVIVMTTEVILGSFLRKYSAISGLDVDFLKTLFMFRPVIVGERMGVYGGQLQFNYSLHSIPCVGFSAYCNNKSMVYSADTFNDEKGIQKFFELGLMAKARMDKLLNFGWHHDLILHEQGVPPIHTPLTTFENLPADVKKRLYLVHTKTIPEGKGLQKALVGVENTIVISNEKGPGFQEMEVLDLVGNIDIFSRLIVARGIEIISCAKHHKFKAKETVVKEGGSGTSMFVIAMGTVAVSVGGSFIKNLNVGDHFGEMSIIMGGQRSATITATTPVEVITFTKHDFLHIVRRTDAIERLRQLAIKHRTGRSWQCIEKNSLLSELSTSQKTYLQSLLKKRIVTKGQVLWSVGDEAKGAVLIDQGKYVFSGATDSPPFTTGAFVGDMSALYNGTPLYTSLVCIEAGGIYYISKHLLLKFLDDNPGLRLSFMNRKFIE